MLRNDVHAPRNLVLNRELHAYLMAQNGSAPDALLTELVEHTRLAFPELAHMVVAPEQGVFLTFLVRLLGARRILEVGTFTGYSAICLARGLPVGGSLTTCDISAESTNLARRFWHRAGVGDRVDLRLGPALDTLRGLPTHRHLDLAFIDADKPGYIDYWQQIVPRMRPNGLIVVDNTLFNGEVVDASPGVKAAAVCAFNAMALADARVERVLLPVADGLTLARVLPEVAA